MYQPFVYQPQPDDRKGWAADAGDYAKLLEPNTIYFPTWKDDLGVQVKGPEYRMFLRGRNKVARLTPHNLQAVNLRPLLWFAPPYQTGFKPGKSLHDLSRAIEMRTRRISLPACISDQVVAVAKRWPEQPRPAPGG